MSYIISNQNATNHPGIGGKATNLARLEKLGIRVPQWAVIPQEVLLEQLPAEIDETNFAQHFQGLSVPEEFMAELKEHFGENYQNKTYAVRSSAVDEDGSRFSFAGQFETFLHVRFEEIEEKIKTIWRSVVSERVLKYRNENNLPLQFGIGVIVQEMISPDVAGVAFGIDPVSGKDSKVISVVYGLGEGLVSGDLNADTFTITNNKIESKLAEKTHQFIKGKNGQGIIKTDVEKQKQNVPALNEVQIKEITDLLDKLNDTLQSPQDIEFGFVNNKLYLLQTRPITAAGSKTKGEYILWDNSNIIESYPGITTPLTFSFIIKMYEQVYRQFAGLMGVTEKELNLHSEVFANTLGLVRGRVYYNLLSWYKMLAMVPGYSINAEFMETMMGVKERFELQENYHMSKGLAWWRILKMGMKMIRLQAGLSKARKRFQAHLNKTMTEYSAMDFTAMSTREIIARYNACEQSLLLEWKAPLINDFFAMIWFGMLQKQTAKYCPEVPNIHNDLLCGSQDIISVEPIHKTIGIAGLIQNDKKAVSLFKEKTPGEIWGKLAHGSLPKIKAAVDEYIDRFGERCVGELKLETISYAQNPVLLMKVIKSYVEQGITQTRAQSNIENELRQASEKKIFAALKGKPLKRRWFKYVLRKARDLVSNRENLRYERTRGFGMVRKMFSALGDQLFKEGHLSNPRDVFYLELDEIKELGLHTHTNSLKGEPLTAHQEGVAKKEVMVSPHVPSDSLMEGPHRTIKGNHSTEAALISPLGDQGVRKLKSKIESRKKEFAKYKTQPPPQERFFTYGHNFTEEYIYSTEKLETLTGDLKGIGCCPGRVQAKVRVVADPNEVDSLNGDILVTSTTDPGWVTIFPTASGIIVERGSLLSHSAIVSREMGIPCIVSVTGLLRTLQTGDEVIMDGSTGEIKIIH